MKKQTLKEYQEEVSKLVDDSYKEENERFESEAVKLLEWMGLHKVTSGGVVGYGSYHVFNERNLTPSSLLEEFNNRALFIGGITIAMTFR